MKQSGEEVWWIKAREEGKRGILNTVFARFAVDRQRIVDVEVKVPFNWLLRLKRESIQMTVSDKTK